MPWIVQSPFSSTEKPAPGQVAAASLRFQASAHCRTGSSSGGVPSVGQEPTTNTPSQLLKSWNSSGRWEVKDAGTETPSWSQLALTSHSSPLSENEAPEHEVEALLKLQDSSQFSMTGVALAPPGTPASMSTATSHAGAWRYRDVVPCAVMMGSPIVAKRSGADGTCLVPAAHRPTPASSGSFHAGDVQSPVDGEWASPGFLTNFRREGAKMPR